MNVQEEYLKNQIGGIGDPDQQEHQDLEERIPINGTDIGARSMFYPADWKFRVHPATTEAIRNWSYINEGNLGSLHRWIKLGEE